MSPELMFVEQRTSHCAGVISSSGGSGEHMGSCHWSGEQRIQLHGFRILNTGEAGAGSGVCRFCIVQRSLLQPAMDLAAGLRAVTTWNIPMEQVEDGAGLIGRTVHTEMGFMRVIDVVAALGVLVEIITTAVVLLQVPAFVCLVASRKAKLLTSLHAR